jgi:hypothetical protein
MAQEKMMKRAATDSSLLCVFSPFLFVYILTGIFAVPI